MHTDLNRRQFLAAGALTLTAAGLAGCTSTSKTTSFVGPDSAAVEKAESKRRRTGTTVQRALTAEPTTVDLAGPGPHTLVARAWDTTGACQPESARTLWNPKGYVNNSWARVRVNPAGDQG